jgi:sec-independent protein translocase protein TatA
MPNIGPVELIIVLVIVLVIFGARRVPEAGKNLGKGMREFKDAVTGNKESDDKAALEASNEPQTSGQATAPPEAAAAPAPPSAPEPEPEPAETARSGESSG